MSEEAGATRETVSRRAVLGGIGGVVLAGAVTAPADARVAPKSAPLAQQQVAADPELWRLGNIDTGAGSFEEFRDYQPGTYAQPELVTVPADWRTRTQWNTVVSKGLKASIGPAMKITYNLDSVPTNGAVFEVKITGAHRSTPQMAVLSKRYLMGMIQIAGVGGAASFPGHFPKIYRVYIPKEFLDPGTNVLRLEAPRSFSGTATEDPYLRWTWDYLRLLAPTAPVAEPVHGRPFHLGTMIAQGGFGYDQGAINHLKPMLEWLGIAYSGNVMRAGFWSNLRDDMWRVHGLDYLKTLRDLNMRVVADHVSTKDRNVVNAEGNLTQAAQTELNGFLDTYGDYIQYYEVDNEPAWIGGGTKAEDIAIARYAKQAVAERAPHVKVVAPGWAYLPDDGWSRDPGNRWEVEQHCALTNGHSYAMSYAAGRGSSFVENILTYQNHPAITDGLPRPMLVTETGTKNGAIDDPIFGTTQPNAAAFDRILRAHVGFADHVMQHAAFFSEYQMFRNNFELSEHEPTTTEAYPFGSGQQTRVDIFRRIACAYATRGKPLRYEYLDTATRDRKVYTRAVNTATLNALPGSGGKSSKVLISVVNFDTNQFSVSLRVWMPSSGRWTGSRFGHGDSYTAARTAVTKDATPTIDLNPTVAPGEAVQFILTPSS